MDQIMYIKERIKDVEDIQNGITIDNIVPERLFFQRIPCWSKF
jgi:hypothetical protein